MKPNSQKHQDEKKRSKYFHNKSPRRLIKFFMIIFSLNSGQKRRRKKIWLNLCRSRFDDFLWRKDFAALSRKLITTTIWQHYVTTNKQHQFVSVSWSIPPLGSKTQNNDKKEIKFIIIKKLGRYKYAKQKRPNEANRYSRCANLNRRLWREKRNRRVEGKRLRVERDRDVGLVSATQDLIVTTRRRCVSCWHFEWEEEEEGEEEEEEEGAEASQPR